MPKLREGFAGQKMIVLPDRIIKHIKNNPLLNSLFITDIGYYPKAKFHYRERKSGCNQHILIYCVEGKGWYEFQDRRYEIEPDDYFILPAECLHRYGADAESPWSIYWTHFTGSASNNFINSFTGKNQAIHQTISHIDNRLQIFEELYQTLEKGYSIENLGYACTCLWHFLGSFRFADAYSNTKTDTTKDPVEASIQFMKNNLHRSLALEDLAESARYSVSYYSSLFREKTGYSPVNYFIHLKIQRACQYLDLTGLHVKEVARKLGYRDPYYFSRLFHKVMDVSPSEYRKRDKG